MFLGGNWQCVLLCKNLIFRKKKMDSFERKEQGWVDTSQQLWTHGQCQDDPSSGGDHEKGNTHSIIPSVKTSLTRNSWYMI